MEKEKDTVQRKTHQKDEEIKEKVKEIEDLKLVLRKKDQEYQAAQQDM